MLDSTPVEKLYFTTMNNLLEKAEGINNETEVAWLSYLIIYNLSLIQKLSDGDRC